jgi:WhiB family redox-sensing transcriptional regulator
MDSSLFFPVTEEAAEPAKRVCFRCDVRVPCLQYSFEQHERYGVWGGIDEHERAEALRRGLAQRLLERQLSRAG